ncbi:MAG: hypothetical protein FD167_5044 [bacterium]|nr:MAG: hypothetical protein FD167_5044 [bacterium]
MAAAQAAEIDLLYKEAESCYSGGAGGGDSAAN